MRRCTHTFSSGDVHGAGDVGEALVHAHLQEDDPVMGNAHNVQYMTGNIHMRSFNAHKRTQAGISSLTSAKSDRHLLAHLYLFMYTHIHTHTHTYTHIHVRDTNETHTRTNSMCTRIHTAVQRLLDPVNKRHLYSNVGVMYNVGNTDS